MKSLRLAPCALRCVVALCLAGASAGAPLPAQADWPIATLVYSGDDAGGIPTGAAIRSWGPTDRVYILFERVTEDDNDSDALLHEYACSDNDDCATASIVTLRGVGDAIGPLPNLLHPSLGVHLKAAEGPDPVELVMALRQKLVADCDGDSVANDADEPFNLDQYAARWTSNNLGVEHTVEANDGAGTCIDHGRSRARFLGETAHLCVTQSTVPGAQSGDRMVCDDDDSATTTWVNEVVMNDGAVPGNFEDHGSFDFYGPNDDRVVAAHFGGNGMTTPDQIRVHFPDAGTAPPNEPMVTFDATGTADWANHPSVLTADGMLHLVWDDDTGDDAQILYSSCDFSATVDCTGDDWTAPTVVAGVSTGFNRDARFPQIAVHGDKQFVMYQYDADGGVGVKMRVVVTERCGTGGWSPSIVRSPPQNELTRDQSVEVGYPGLVLNRDEQIAHVAFVDLDDFAGDAQFDTASEGKLWWYRKGYDLCE